MSRYSVVYKEEVCTARRVNVYVKRGAYEHGYVKGWELVNEAGDVVIDSQPGRPRSAYEYQQASYPTLKALKKHVESVNDHFKMLAARQSASKVESK